MRGSGVVDGSVDDEVPVDVDDVDGVVVDEGELDPDGAVDVDEPVLVVDEEPDDEDEDELDDPLESVGSARATPGIVATAVPTPRATASAPTRPT